MRKFLSIVIIVSFLMGFSAFLHDAGAASASISDTATVKSNISAYRFEVGNKFARGSKNILFGWTELPKRVVDLTKQTNNPFWGILAGTFQGSLKAMARTASGLSDVVTAPISPEKGPFIKQDIDVD